MMVHGNPPTGRPETVWDEYGPRFGEYPVCLNTRRTWSLQADDVLSRRETAPNAVWADPRSRPYVPWDRGE